MDFITWIMGFILWETMIECEKEEEMAQNVIVIETIGDNNEA